ncbi:MAG TPA: cytochrome b/b6 domain-containing protein [bacterium]|nr:cytochrome b/b6 domain-containing protein [bacterium]
MKNERYAYRRFGLFFRIQHGLLFSSVIIAVITGLPMKYPDAWLSRVTVMLMGGVQMRAFLHHAAGLTMVVLGIVHIVYYVFIDRRVPFYKRPVLFRLKDLRDMVQHQQYNLGLRKDFPRMGRYTWFEKFDYIGVIWGIAVMALTGLPMLYMNTALKFIPLSWLQALWAAHSDEAMLATLFLLVIHMYHVHFSPERFPMTLTWWHGRVTREDMEKYHPLELEAWERKQREAEERERREAEARARAAAEAAAQSESPAPESAPPSTE